MGEIVTAIVMIAGFIGWVVKQVQEQQQGKAAPPVKRPAPPARRPGAPEAVQAERDFFLADPERPTGRPRPAERAPAAPPRVSAAPPASRGASSRPAKAAAAPSRAPARPAPAASRGGSDPTGSRPVVDPNLGRGVNEHVARNVPVGGGVAENVARHMSHDVDRSVQEHLGSFSAAVQASATVSPSKQQRSAAVDALKAAIHRPASIRQAILLVEVLARPKAMRRPGEDPLTVDRPSVRTAARA
jgi:hypothetical protein